MTEHRVSGELLAQCLLQHCWNLDLSLLGIGCKRDGHEIARLYVCDPASSGIDDDVLNSTPVPNCAAPSVAIYSHFYGHLGFAPDISRVEWQRERGTCVLL